MQVIVCDDDIENLNEMIQVCYDVLAKGTEVRGFSDASMLAEAVQAAWCNRHFCSWILRCRHLRVWNCESKCFEAAYDRYYLCNIA